MSEIWMRVFAYIGIGVTIVLAAGATAVVGLVLAGKYRHENQESDE